MIIVNLAAAINFDWALKMAIIILLQFFDDNFFTKTPWSSFILNSHKKKSFKSCLDDDNDDVDVDDDDVDDADAVDTW